MNVNVRARELSQIRTPTICENQKIEKSLFLEK